MKKEKCGCFSYASLDREETGKEELGFCPGPGATVCHLPRDPLTPVQSPAPARDRTAGTHCGLRQLHPVGPTATCRLHLGEE